VKTGAWKEGSVEQAGFELFEVTADVGITASADTLHELFSNAARGMFALMIAPDTTRPAGSLSVEARGTDLPSLLVAWLNELLYRCEVEEWAPADVRVLEVEGGRVHGELLGEPADPARHRFKTIVKAATYHLLECRRDGDRWRARVVFDV
jgi:SHS2 domain-containing protein